MLRGDVQDRRGRKHVGESIRAEEDGGVRLEWLLDDVHELPLVLVAIYRPHIPEHFVPARVTHRLRLGERSSVLELSDG